MLRDITIDTNVLVHAANPSQGWFGASVRMLRSMLSCETSLCVDRGFSLVESQNASLIGGEYQRHVLPGTLGYAVLTSLAASGRVKALDRGLPIQHRREIQRLVSNRRDRTFVGVALNSLDCVLASHDYADFTEAVRERLLNQLHLHIVEAEECCVRLAPA